MREFLTMLPSRKGGMSAGSGFFAATIVLLLSAIYIGSAAPAQAQQFRFTTFAIDGNLRVDDSTIIGLTGIRPGQTVSGSQVAAAVAQLSGSGLFESVDVTPRGTTLAITVQEYPVIGIVNFEGNRRIDDDDISEVVETRAGMVLSPSRVEADARAIAELYSRRGRTAAEVTPKILPRGNNRVDLAFEIREGAVVEIERVSFVGNRAFSNYRLRQVLSTKQAGVLRWLIQSDTFIAERIALDRQLLTDFYLSRGFVDFEILSVTSEMSRERDRFFVTFNLREGQQYRFGNLTLVSEVDGISAADYEGDIGIRPGTLFTPETLDRAIARLEQRAQRQGLRFIQAEPRFTRNNRTQTIDVEFAMIRGDRLFVERIDIQGNTTTQDRVVRRQFALAEGDPLNPREIREAAERIRALDYFSDVSVEPRAGSAPDQAIVDVQLEETPTGSLGFSVSYAANEGIGFGISFSELNFLGRGQELAVNFNVISGSRDISVIFTEPALFDRDLSYSLGVGYQETSQLNSNFNTRQAFLNNSIAFPVSEFGRLQLRQTFLLDRLRGLDANSSNRIRLDETAGTAITGGLGYTYSFDTRERGIDPTQGMILSLSQDFGVGNQSRRFVRTELRAGYEMSFFGEDLKVTGDARAGLLHMVSGSSRFNNRFQLADVMRGFRPGASGPRDFGAVNEDVIGGNRYFVLSAETRFPLGTPEEYGLSGGVFADVGSVWGADNTGLAGVNMFNAAGENSNRMHMRATLGVSLFWDSPLGLLRFDFSRAVRKRDYDRPQNFDFSIVSRF